MSNDQKQEGIELFDQTASDQLDGGTDTSASTSTDTDNSSSEVEESQSQSAEQERQKQVQHHLALALSDPNHLESLKGKQAWLANAVEAKLQSVGGPDEERIAQIVEERLEKRLRKEREDEAKRREEDMFASERKRLNELRTTDRQRKEMQEKFEFYVKNGMNKLAALKEAASAARIDFNPEQKRRQSMSLPSMTGTPVKGDDASSMVLRQPELDHETNRKLALAKSSAYKNVNVGSLN